MHVGKIVNEVGSSLCILLGCARNPLIYQNAVASFKQERIHSAPNHVLRSSHYAGGKMQHTFRDTLSSFELEAKPNL